MMTPSPSVLINQLEASTLLAGTWILTEIEKTKASLTYRTDTEVYSFADYFQILMDEVNRIPHIKLDSYVTPGAHRAYLITLTTSLEAVLDSIEVVHNKALFLQTKIRAAKVKIHNLNNSFKAWYLIAMQQELARFEIKLAAKALDSLAEQEFSRLIDGVQEDLTGLDDLLGVVVDRLKSRKRLAQEKYKIGQDQANMSLLPQLGSQQGYVEGQNPFGALQNLLGLNPQIPSEEPIEEIPEEPLMDEPDPALLRGSRKTTRTSTLVNREGKPLEYEVEEPTEAPVAVEVVHEGCWMTPTEETTFTITEEPAEVVFNTQSVQVETPQAQEESMEDILEEAKICRLDISAPVVETPVTLDVTPIAELPRARREVFKEEEGGDVQSVPTPALPEITEKAPTQEPSTPTVISVRKRRVVFDDRD